MTIPGFTRTDTGLTCDRCHVEYSWVSEHNTVAYDIDEGEVCAVTRTHSKCTVSSNLPLPHLADGCLYCGKNAANRVYVSRDGTREPLVVTRFTGQTTDLAFCAEGYKVKGYERTVPASWVHADYRPETAAERREREAGTVCTHSGCEFQAGHTYSHSTDIVLTGAPNDDNPRANRERIRNTVNNLLNERKAKPVEDAPPSHMDARLLHALTQGGEEFAKEVARQVVAKAISNLLGTEEGVMALRSEYIKQRLADRQPKVYVQTDEDGDV